MFPQHHNTPYLLDTISGAILACSTRRLVQDAPTNLARIRRDSDNTEAYIYHFSDFLYPTSPTDNPSGSVQDFLAGSNAKIRQWIDQSNLISPKNGNQTTASSQPKLTNNGLGKVSVIEFQNTTIHNLDFGTSIVSSLTGADKKFSIVLCFKHSAALVSGSPSIISMFNTGGATIAGIHVSLKIISLNQQTVSFDYGNGSNRKQINTSTWYAPNTLYSLVISYDGTIDTSGSDRVKIYVNNAIIPQTETATFGSFPFDISNPSLGLTMPWIGNSSSSNGFLGEFLIFDKVLSVDEVDFIYKQHKNYFGA